MLGEIKKGLAKKSPTNHLVTHTKGNKMNTNDSITHLFFCPADSLLFFLKSFKTLIAHTFRPQKVFEKKRKEYILVEKMKKGLKKEPPKKTHDRS